MASPAVDALIAVGAAGLFRVFIYLFVCSAGDRLAHVRHGPVVFWFFDKRFPFTNTAAQARPNSDLRSSSSFRSSSKMKTSRANVGAPETTQRCVQRGVGRIIHDGVLRLPDRPQP